MIRAELLMASGPEKKVYYALKKLGFIEGKDFYFQSQMLGFPGAKGSTRVDFRLPLFGLVLRVVGEYWHSFPEAKARDLLQKVAMTTEGWLVIDLMESDIMRDVDSYVQEAILGRDHSREL